MFTWAVGQGLVERTGKQAKRVAAALASKARNHYKQAISKFRTQVADDREIFTKKIAEMQQHVAAKSAENSKSFGRWVHGQTSSMEGTLAGIEEAYF